MARRWRQVTDRAVRAAALRAIVVVVVVGATGCGLFGIGGDGGEGQDGAVAGGGDGGMGLVDMTPPPDVALPPDFNTSFISATWNLINQNLQGKPNNGFSVKCDDATAGTAELRFAVTNGANQTSTTNVPCPAGAAIGDAVLAVPDPMGPYTVSATAAGRPMSASEKIKNVMPAGRITVRVYSLGCDNGPCL